MPFRVERLSSCPERKVRKVDRRTSFCNGCTRCHRPLRHRLRTTIRHMACGWTVLARHLIVAQTLVNYRQSTPFRESASDGDDHGRVSGLGVEVHAGSACCDARFHEIKPKCRLCGKRLLSANRTFRGFRTIRSERSAEQLGVDVVSMDHVHALRDEMSGLREARTDSDDIEGAQAGPQRFPERPFHFAQTSFGEKSCSSNPRATQTAQMTFSFAFPFASLCHNAICS